MSCVLRRRYITDIEKQNADNRRLEETFLSTAGALYPSTADREYGFRRLEEPVSADLRPSTGTAVTAEVQETMIPVAVNKAVTYRFLHIIRYIPSKPCLVVARI